MSAGGLAESQLVQLVYDVAESERGGLDGWQTLLTEFARHLGADKGHVFLVDPSDRMVETRFCGMETKAIADYHDHYQDIDPRFSHARQRLDRVFSDVEVLERRSFVGTEIYNDYLDHHGIEWSMFVNVQYAPGQVAPQAYFRERGQGPFLPEDVARLQRLVPHLARALRFRLLLSAAENQTQALQHVMDDLALPLLVLGSAGEVLWHTASAEELLATLPQLTLRQQRLGASSPLLATKLECALKSSLKIAEAGAKAVALEPPALVEVEREGRAPVALLYLPLRPASTLREKGPARGRVLIAFHDPERVLRLDPAVIGQLFHLTPTEAALASALAEGQTVLQFALKRGSSEQTARVHLKRLLEKTQTRRQPDLVRLLLTSSALMLSSQK